MFYRPEFCCSCGDKIERVDWKPWTSRRFCDLCATKHQVSEIVPKMFAGAGVLIGILGIGSYLRTSQASGPPITKRVLVAKANSQPIQAPPNFRTTEPSANQSQTSSSNKGSNVAEAEPVAGKTKTEPVLASEPVYYCGAETRKGTPCTRKVKGSVRCWQHKGMPAMLPSAKLLVSN